MAETVLDRMLVMVRAACAAGNAGVRSVDVAEALRLDVEHANTALSKLVRRGLLERPLRGLYSVHPPLTHRPSRLDAEHTACGLKLGDDTHLRLGDGETCAQCTHVVAQVAAAVRGEPSWASVPAIAHGDARCTCGHGLLRHENNATDGLGDDEPQKK